MARSNYSSKEARLAHATASLEARFCTAGVHLDHSRAITLRCHAAGQNLQLLRFPLSFLNFVKQARKYNDIFCSTAHLKRAEMAQS